MMYINNFQSIIFILNRILIQRYSIIFSERVILFDFPNPIVFYFFFIYIYIEEELYRVSFKLLSISQVRDNLVGFFG